MGNQKSYYLKKLEKNAEGLERPSPVLDYPLSPQGLVVSKRQSFHMRPSDRALAPDHPGSVHQIAEEVFGGYEKFVLWAETGIDTAGENKDKVLFEFCLLYRQWERKFKLKMLDKLPNLNQVCYGLRLSGAEVVEKVTAVARSAMREMGRSKASLAAPKLIEAAIKRAKTARGYKDTEMLLKIAEVIAQEAPGVQVNVNQQQAIGVNMTAADRERLKAPLLQFQDLVEEVDSKVREDVIEGEVLDG